MTAEKIRPTLEELATRPFLTATEVAALLGIRQSKILSWLRSGELRGADLSLRPGRGNARWKIARTDLDEFLEARQPRPVPKETTSSRRRGKSTTPPGWIEYIK